MNNLRAAQEAMKARNTKRPRRGPKPGSKWKRGQPITNNAELVKARLLRSTPIDPSGVSYTINPVGEIGVDQSSQLYPLPTEPAASPELRRGTPAAQ